MCQLRRHHPRSLHASGDKARLLFDLPAQTAGSQQDGLARSRITAPLLASAGGVTVGDIKAFGTATRHHSEASGTLRQAHLWLGAAGSQAKVHLKDVKVL